MENGGCWSQNDPDVHKTPRGHNYEAHLSMILEDIGTSQDIIDGITGFVPGDYLTFAMSEIRLKDSLPLDTPSPRVRTTLA